MKIFLFKIVILAQIHLYLQLFCYENFKKQIPDSNKSLHDISLEFGFDLVEMDFGI